MLFCHNKLLSLLIPSWCMIYYAFLLEYHHHFKKLVVSCLTVCNYCFWNLPKKISFWFIWAPIPGPKIMFKKKARNWNTLVCFRHFLTTMICLSGLIKPEGTTFDFVSPLYKESWEAKGIRILREGRRRSKSFHIFSIYYFLSFSGKRLQPNHCIVLHCMNTIYEYYCSTLLSLFSFIQWWSLCTELFYVLEALL